MRTEKHKKIEEIKIKIDKQSDLKKRVISSIFLFLILGIYVGLSIIYTEGTKDGLNNADVASYFNFAITLMLTGAASYELMKAMGIGKNNKLYYVPGIIMSMAMVLLPFSNEHSWALYNAMEIGQWNKWYLPLLESLLAAALFFVLAYYGTGSIKNGFLLIIYSFVVIIGFKGFTEIALTISGNNPTFGFNTIIWIWLIIILTDTFAYFGGRKFGKTKLAPAISPKKTWEGSVIGSSVAIVFGTAYGVLFFYLLKDYGPMTIAMQTVEDKGRAVPGILIALLTILISFASQIGDLFFSWYKRVFNVKDFSNLIPGHGGILDRLDSFLFVFFIMYFIALATQ